MQIAYHDCFLASIHLIRNPLPVLCDIRKSTFIAVQYYAWWLNHVRTGKWLGDAYTLAPATFAKRSSEGARGWYLYVAVYSDDDSVTIVTPLYRAEALRAYQHGRAAVERTASPRADT